jgi:nucleosome binding factor SPN SPT16 subunit
MGGSSTQSGSSDESASKKPKITGTTCLTTTDFTTSIKVDVEKTLFEKDAKTKEEDAEKKRAEEEKKEADRVEANPLYNAKAKGE